MTQPRTVCPGDVVFVTSRIVARFFLMGPDREMNDAFGYLLAVYAAKYGIFGARGLRAEHALACGAG